MTEDLIVTLEGPALEQFVEACEFRRPLYRVRIHDDGTHIKFKFDEGMWSPPIPKEES